MNFTLHLHTGLLRSGLPQLGYANRNTLNNHQQYLINLLHLLRISPWISVQSTTAKSNFSSKLKNSSVEVTAFTIQERLSSITLLKISLAPWLLLIKAIFLGSYFLFCYSKPDDIRDAVTCGSWFSENIEVENGTDSLFWLKP